MVKKLSGMAATSGVLRAPQMDGDRLRAYFGRGRGVECAEVLARVALEGVPAEIQTIHNLDREPAYGDHRNAAKYQVEFECCSVACITS